ncbi:MAG: NAD-dependent epimerase/dehydratase family protein [Patescibacteria group bacterium]
MKIVVTGGAGFIGTNTCLEARSRGHEVIAFDNFVRPLTEENISVLMEMEIKIIRGDVRNETDFDKLPWIPDGIIHLAGQCGIPYAQISPRYDFEVNALGTINVLEYSRLHGKIPIAFASSNKAYTNLTNEYPIREEKTRYVWTEDRKSLSENVPLDAFGKYARSLYGTSKVSGDLYMQEYYQAFDVPTVVNRMSCIYGYYQKGIEDQGWADWMARQIITGDRKINIFGTGKQVRDMLWGADCADLYVDEIENIDRVVGKVYNIGGGINNTMSLLEAIKYIEDESGNKAELTFLPKRHGDQDIWISDISKIKEDLGWEPQVSPQQGLKLMIERM